MYTVDFNKPANIYFIGIGGSSMSGLAEIMLKRGFHVSGSDPAENSSIDKLKEMGIKVSKCQEAANITDDIDFIIYTAAISQTNPEYLKATELGINMLERAPFLGQLMKLYKNTVGVAGTHGKTTTSSMVACILLSAGIDISASLGGVCDEIGGNSKSGTSDYFVAESCEYKRSFLSFNPSHEIVTNIEAEHLDYYKDIDDIRSAFRDFLKKPSKDGYIVINGDIEKVNELTNGLPGHVLFYGVCEDNNEINAITKYDYFARNISFDECGHGEFDLMHSLKSQNSSEKIMHIKLGVVGMHNVSNATAAVALCLCLGISIDKIIDALAKFHGAKRRFEIKGKLAGCVTIIDDYAHHPSEIRATLNAAHKYPHKTIWTVFQPHTYSRLRKFLPDFASSLILSDRIVLTDVYAAREKDPGDISSLDLLKKINELCPDNPSKAVYFSSFGEIEDFLLTNAVSGDIIFMMGAGSVIQIGDELLGRQTS